MEYHGIPSSQLSAPCQLFHPGKKFWAHNALLPYQFLHQIPGRHPVVSKSTVLTLGACIGHPTMNPDESIVRICSEKRINMGAFASIVRSTHPPSTSDEPQCLHHVRVEETNAACGTRRQKSSIIMVSATETLFRRRYPTLMAA